MDVGAILTVGLLVAVWIVIFAIKIPLFMIGAELYREILRGLEHATRVQQQGGVGRPRWLLRIVISDKARKRRR